MIHRAIHKPTGMALALAKTIIATSRAGESLERVAGDAAKPTTIWRTNTAPINVPSTFVQSYTNRS